MTKKLYVKALGHEHNVVAGSDKILNENYASWQMEEDIIVLGCSLTCGFENDPGNDGFSRCQVCLASSAGFEPEAEIGMAFCHTQWNTAPAGVDSSFGNLTIMFPSGYGIPIKEEGHLYVGVALDGRNQTAGTPMGFGIAEIYYVRGKVTK